MTNFLPRLDVVVFPGVADDEVYADRFLLVAEVLSPSNTKSLIAQKGRRYKQHPDNLYCLVIDSRRVWLQMHFRRSDWRPVTLADPTDVLELPDFGLGCAVGELYRRSPLHPGRATGKNRVRSA